MRITRIEPQQRRPRRKNIYGDGRFLAGVSDETLLRLGLRTGDEVTPDLLKAILRTEELHGAKAVALRFLSTRPRTEREIRDKLREKEFSDEDIARTIKDLKDSGLINDGEFARMYVRDQLALKASGKLLLRRKLLLLGVERTVVDEVLEESFRDVDPAVAARHAAEQFLRKSRAGNTRADRLKQQKRLADFLGRRGFSWEVIGPVVKQLVRGNTTQEGEE